ncbi:pyridoxine 5-phosphate synthase [Sesbania bispinosa]|nr:pyridoxine 5-phosphate synthase [Sesbania bispinosa]
MKGKASALEKRTGASKCSSSSSTSRRLLCGCGEEVCLLRSHSVKNPGRKRSPATIFVGQMMKRQRRAVRWMRQKHHSQKKLMSGKKSYEAIEKAKGREVEGEGGYLHGHLVNCYDNCSLCHCWVEL